MKVRAAGLFILAALAVPSVALSQLAIPQPVIDQCNADQDARLLPKCLKMNAVAFEMLETVQSAEFYSASAKPVIDGCLKANESYLKTWLCFKSAASKAVEARELVGVENITDTCVVGISDPEVFNRVQTVFNDATANMHINKLNFPSSFYGFSGCPSQ